MCTHFACLFLAFCTLVLCACMCYTDSKESEVILCRFVIKWTFWKR
nr:MAG TPA: hypothetical protein [Caudoviricetes sp.]